MKILIGITSKNRSSILPKAIDASKAQTYPFKEIWVFDDASTDDTILLKDQFPDIHWIFSDEPKGYVYARNLMMQQEGFDFYCSLDDDSWFLDENLLVDAIKFMQENPKTGAIAFDILSPDNPEHKQNKITYTETNTFIGCGHIVRLEALEKIGYYVPNPGYYGGEEKDLCIRLIDEGYQIIKFNGGYVWHEKTNIARNQPAQHKSGVCNDLIFSARRVPILILFPYLLYKICSHFRFAVTYQKGLLFKPFLAGVGSFLVSILKNKLYRNPVQMSTLKKFIKLSR